VSVLVFRRGPRDYFSLGPHPEDESGYLCASDKLIDGGGRQESEYGILIINTNKKKERHHKGGG